MEKTPSMAAENNCTDAIIWAADAQCGKFSTWFNH